MKIAKIESDYSSSRLSIIQTDDGDIVVGLYDRGEFRIVTSGGRYHGKRLGDIVNKFSELIDLLNEEESQWLM